MLVALPLLGRTVADVRTARAVLLALPPELILRSPSIVRFLQDIMENGGAGARRWRARASSADEKDDAAAQDDGVTPGPGHKGVRASSKRVRSDTALVTTSTSMTPAATPPRTIH